MQAQPQRNIESPTRTAYNPHAEESLHSTGRREGGVSFEEGGQMKKTQYKVWNCYGIRGESTHRTPEAALRAARRREGDGWMVTDSDGDRWLDNRGTAVCFPAVYA